jgi:hypothetical protein
MSYALFPLGPLRALAIVALLVALGAVILFAIPNTASKTIVLATAALSGAALLYLVQLCLELRSTKESDFISVELTIDRTKPVLRQWRYSRESGYPTVWRLHYEEDASKWLAQNAPTAFSGDREQLAYDFALAEILLFFARAQFDWQLATTSFKGAKFRMETFEPVSKKDDCAELGPAEFAAALKRAGNALADYKSLMFPNRPVCFPPDTTMTVSANSLTLSNPFGSLQFTIVPGSLSHMEPESRIAEVPALENGEPRFEERLFGIRIVNRQTALYSQHRDTAKQAAWRKRVIDGLHSWFENQ